MRKPHVSAQHCQLSQVIRVAGRHDRGAERKGPARPCGLSELAYYVPRKRFHGACTRLGGAAARAARLARERLGETALWTSERALHRVRRSFNPESVKKKASSAARGAHCLVQALLLRGRQAIVSDRAARTVVLCRPSDSAGAPGPSPPRVLPAHLVRLDGAVGRRVRHAGQHEALLHLVVILWRKRCCW
jgi:hypothetical protein